MKKMKLLFIFFHTLSKSTLLDTNPFETVFHPFHLQDTKSTPIKFIVLFNTILSLTRTYPISQYAEVVDSKWWKNNSDESM